jgi:hypothetical protein
MAQQLAALSNDQLRRVAPSIFATEPWESVSDRYAFIPTIQVVDHLRDEGFVPVRATQSRSVIPGKKEFTKHMLRFRRMDDLSPAVLHQELPEIVLINSHDRTSSYQLSAGIFRLACLNGMVVKSADFGSIKVNHTGNIVDQVVEGSCRIIEEAPALMERIKEWKGIQLAPREQLAFATSALELRYPTPEGANPSYPVRPESVMAVRRYDDRKDDLWTVSNRIQENFMKGGLRAQTTTGRRTTTRSITSVDSEMKINKALWQLTEHMAVLKNQG